MGINDTHQGDIGRLEMGVKAARRAPRPATVALALTGLAVLGATGGSAAAALTAGGPEVVIGDVSGDRSPEAPVAQAGLTTPATTNPPATRVVPPRSPATSTAQVGMDPLPSSASGSTSAVAVPPAPAVAPSSVRVVPAPAPRGHRLRPIPAPARAPAPAPAPPWTRAPAPPPPPAPAPAPAPPAIHVPLLPVQPPPVVRPKHVTIG